MRWVACALLLGVGSPCFAHRLDEYLQVATISIAKDRVRTTMFLNPGVAVFRRVIALLDPNGDGIVSGAEQKAYAERVRHDLSLSVDGAPLKLRIVAYTFPKVEELKKGLGYIKVELDATVPSGRGNHRLFFENRHQKSFAAFMVNGLVPDDPNFRVTAQTRNFDQSRYVMDYAQAASSSGRTGR